MPQTTLHTTRGKKCTRIPPIFPTFTVATRTSMVILFDDPTRYVSQTAAAAGCPWILNCGGASVLQLPQLGAHCIRHTYASWHGNDVIPHPVTSFSAVLSSASPWFIICIRVPSSQTAASACGEREPSQDLGEGEDLNIIYGVTGPDHAPSHLCRLLSLSRVTWSATVTLCHARQASTECRTISASFPKCITCIAMR